MRPGEIAELLQEERLETSPPVDARVRGATDGQGVPLSLIGIKGKGRRYRRTLRSLQPDMHEGR